MNALGTRPADAVAATSNDLRESVTLRNSFRFVVARWVSDLPGIAVGLVGSLTWIASWPAPWGPLVQGLMLLWVASLVVGPVVRWRTAEFHVSSQGIVAETGVLSRRSESLPWDLVASMDHRRSWVCQRLGITEIVCAQTGEDGSRVRLDGLRDDDVAAFRRFADAGATRPEPTATSPGTTPPGPADAGTPEGTVLHRTSTGDLLMLALVYGQVLLLVPPLVMGLMEITDALGLTERLEDALVSGLGTWPTAVVIVTAAVCAGLGATVIKYHDFTVTAQPDGRLHIRYGLFSTHERTITPATVQGLVWHRNVVEQLFGRVRVSVLTLDSTAQLGGNLILPSMRTAQAREIVRKHLPSFAGTERRLSTGPGAGLTNVVCLGLLGAALCGAWVLTARIWHWPWPLAVAACLTGAGVAVRLVHLCTSRLAAEPQQGLFLLRRIGLAEQVTAVRAARLHAVSTRHLAGGGSSTPRGRAWLPSVHWFAGSPRHSTALTASPRTVEQLQRMVRLDSVPLRS